MNVAFNIANQAKLAIKMKCSNFAWYLGSSVQIADDEYVVVVNVSQTNGESKKIIPETMDGVEIKTHLSGR